MGGARRPRSKGVGLKKKTKKTRRAPAAKTVMAEPTAEPEVAPAATSKRRVNRGYGLDKRKAFLRAYSVCASIRQAAKTVRIDHHQHYEWLKEPAYSAAFQQAKVEAAQTIEDDAVEWARIGLFEPNVYQGKFVYPQEEYVVKPAVTGPRGAIREPEVRGWRNVPGAPPYGVYKRSEAVMLRLLSGFMPEKYRANASVELSGPDGGPMELVRRLEAGRERARRMALALQQRDAAEPR